MCVLCVYVCVCVYACVVYRPRISHHHQVEMIGVFWHPLSKVAIDHIYFLFILRKVDNWVGVNRCVCKSVCVCWYVYV